MRLNELLRRLGTVYALQQEQPPTPAIIPIDRYRTLPGGTVLEQYDVRVEMEPFTLYCEIGITNRSDLNITSQDFVIGRGNIRTNTSEDPVTMVLAQFTRASTEQVDRSKIWMPLIERIEEKYRVGIEEDCQGIKNLITPGKNSVAQPEVRYFTRRVDVNSESLNKALADLFSAGRGLERAIAGEQERLRNYLP